MTAPAFVLVGDTHGSLSFAEMAMKFARRHGVRTLIQLGDWGYVWPRADRTEALQQLLRRYDQEMWFLDGNHDWHDELAAKYGEPDRRLSYLSRGSLLPAHPRVGVLGGAPSVDRAYRMVGVDWWPTETITDEQIRKLPATTLNVLLTHDAPEVPPAPWRGMKLDAATEARANRGCFSVRAALAWTWARRLYHGHYHRAYDAVVNGVDVHGLAADGAPGSLLSVSDEFEPLVRGP